MSLKYPPYFLQEEKWASFWYETSKPSHNYFKIEATKKINDLEVTVFAIVYKYPWHLKQNFLYVSKGPTIKLAQNGLELEYSTNVIEKVSKTDLKDIFDDFLKKIFVLAQQQNSTFIKFDFDYQITGLFDIANNSQLLSFIQSKTNRPTQISSKTIQYMSTMTLDMSTLVSKFQNENYRSKLNQISPDEFFEKTSEFWINVEKSLRYSVRKSLGKSWILDSEKTEKNFEDFWEIYTATSKKHSFPTQPKNYIRDLFKKDFSRIMILRDSTETAQSAWFGIITKDTLTHLYGGNTPQSLANFGPSFLHLMAIKMCVQNSLRYYDLGGYDPSKGFGKSKNDFRGEIRNFLGPVDILLKPNVYKIINLITKLAKLTINN